MATGILGTDCSQIIGNTGMSTCPYNIKNIIGFMLVPTGTVVTPTQVSSWKSTVDAGTANNSATARWFPISKFEDVEEKGEDAIETKTGYGINKFVRSGKYGWRFMYSNGAMDLHSELSKFNGQQDRYDVFLMDGRNNCFIGTASGTSNVKGFSLDTLYAPNFKLNTGGADTIYSIEIGLEDESEMNLNWRLITSPVEYPIATTYVGLKPVRLEVVVAPGAAADTAEIRVWCGAANVWDTYSSQINATAVWSITIGSTTTAATAVSIINAQATNKSFLITFGTAIASAGLEAVISFGTVTALNSAAAGARLANSSVNTVTIA